MYNAAKKLADCWYDNLGPSPKKPWYDGHQEIEQALVRLARLVNEVEGRERRQVHRAGSSSCSIAGAAARSMTRATCRWSQQYEAVGHAVGPSTATQAWPTSPWKPRHRLSQRRQVDLAQHRQHEVLRQRRHRQRRDTGLRPELLPAQQRLLRVVRRLRRTFFQHKMNLTYQEARYADLMEETLYNAILGSVDLAGEELRLHQSARLRRSPLRLARVPLLRRQHSPHPLDATDVDLCHERTACTSISSSAAPSRVDGVAGTEVEIVQTTDYPWNGNVNIVVNPPRRRCSSYASVAESQGERALYGIPDGDGITSISVNGPPSPRIENGYAVITREWKPGDKIELKLPMASRVKADESRGRPGPGRVALGPLIYNIESVDQNVESVLAGSTTEDGVESQSARWCGHYSRPVRRWFDDDSHPELCSQQSRRPIYRLDQGPRVRS